MITTKDIVVLLLQAQIFIFSNSTFIFQYFCIHDTFGVVRRLPREQGFNVYQYEKVTYIIILLSK